MTHGVIGTALQERPSHAALVPVRAFLNKHPNQIWSDYRRVFYDDDRYVNAGEEADKIDREKPSKPFLLYQSSDDDLDEEGNKAEAHVPYRRLAMPHRSQQVSEFFSILDKEYAATVNRLTKKKSQCPMHLSQTVTEPSTSITLENATILSKQSDRRWTLNVGELVSHVRMIKHEGTYPNANWNVSSIASSQPVRYQLAVTGYMCVCVTKCGYVL
jgi:hypothetical protein